MERLDHDDRIDGFIASYFSEQDEFLKELEEEALNTGVPIIRRDTQQLLRFILAAAKPDKILEIGTAIGFSAILMAKYTSPDTRIITVEDYEPRIEQAGKNIESSGYGEKIRLTEGDGASIMAGLNESFDMIFIDAAKAQYPRYFEEAKRLLSTGRYTYHHA